MKDALTRRDCLRVGTTAALASRMAAGSARGESEATTGQGYEAEVPDTLDLAERGAFAVNALTGAADPVHNYETYRGGHLDQRPPYLCHKWGGPCTTAKQLFKPENVEL